MPSTLQQVYAVPDDGLSLLVGWDAPVETNGEEITQYIIELKASGSNWNTPDLEVPVLVEDAIATAAAVNAGGKHGNNEIK